MIHHGRIAQTVDEVPDVIYYSIKEGLWILVSTVAMSSAEAEMSAGTCAYMAMSYLRMLKNDLNRDDTDLLWTPPIMMLCDNSSACCYNR